MPANGKRLLVVQAAALGFEFLNRQNDGTKLAGLEFQPLTSVFPAVTCAAQASFKCATTPSSHGMVANGYFSREMRKAFFWEQSSSLVHGPRIWKSLRESGRSVGVLFWQQSLGTDTDLFLSPAPIHKHHGGMIRDCASKPADLYPRLRRALGEFPLAHYWGPMASIKSTRWIAKATAELVRTNAADVLFTYLPHLDYDLQRFGPNSTQATKSYAQFGAELQTLISVARDAGWHILIWGDYAIQDVHRPIYPNRVLRDAGLLETRAVRKMQYPDLASSSAFAMVDHQVANVYVSNRKHRDAAHEVLQSTPGIAQILDDNAKRELGIDHPRSGELVLLADRDAWFAYPWWSNASEAPDYASHIDIHSKPGYDPAELFWGTWPFTVSTDPSRVRGSHGLVGESLEGAWATDLPLSDQPHHLVGLAGTLADYFRGGTHR